MNITTYSASEARKNLYSLIKRSAKGLRSFEITLRGSDPVILVSKKELESWQETLDILSNSQEREAVRIAKKETKTVSHKDMLKEIGLQQ